MPAPHGDATLHMRAVVFPGKGLVRGVSASIADFARGDDIHARVAAAVADRLEMLRRAPKHLRLPGGDSEGIAKIRQ
jgi:hypothetical protein